MQVYKHKMILKVNTKNIIVVPSIQVFPPLDILVLQNHQRGIQSKHLF